MITEDQLEQLAIQWFQGTGWNFVHGAVIAPEGAASEREDFRSVVLKGRLAEVERRIARPLPHYARPAGSLRLAVSAVLRLRAWNSVGDWLRGVAQGSRLVTRWGGCNSQEFLVSLNHFKRRLNP